jgi:hypothetical protein
MTSAPLYRIFWLTSVTDLIPWQLPLTAFFQDVNSQNRFAGWSPLLHYFSHFNKKQHIRLCVVTLAQKPETGGSSYQIHGVLLLKQNDSRPLLPVRLDMVGNTPNMTDANELFVHPSSSAEHMIPVLAKAVLNAPFKWSYLHWQFLQPEDHGQLMANTLASHCYHVHFSADMPRPVLPLPETEADYIKQRATRVKKFVNNKQNRLGRDFPEKPLALRWITPTDAVGLADWFFTTYLSYWHNQGVKTEFHRYPELVAFYTDCLANGLLKMTGYFVGDEPACIFIGYDLPEHTYLLHLTCFNAKYAEYSPGILHNDALIKSLIEKNYKVLDFGLGDLEYKSYFTKTKLPILYAKRC